MPIVAVLAATSLGTSACNTSPYAAKVNGEVISQTSLDSQLRAIASNSTYASRLAGSQPVHGKGPGTFNTAFADQVLFQEVTLRIIGQELARRHVKPTSAQRSAAQIAARQSVGGTLVFSGFPASYRRHLVDQYAAIAALEASVGKVAITNASLLAYYRAHRAAFERVCASFVVAKTQGATAAARSAILGGQSLQAAATSVGGRAGVLGCGVESQYAAQLGQSTASQVFALSLHGVSAPISLGGRGWGLLQVTSRSPQSFAASKLLAESQLLSKAGPAFGKLMTALVNKADIVVNPAYGRVAMVSGNRTIVPPKGPPAAAIYTPPTTAQSPAAARFPGATGAPPSTKGG